MLNRSFLQKISYHWQECWMIFNMCVELFYKMSRRMTGTQIPKLQNWYFADKIFHVALLLRCHIFHAKFTQSFVFIVDDPQLYYQILQRFFRNANALKQKFALKKTKRKQVLELDLSSKEKKKEKAIRETKRKVGFIYDLIVELILVCKVKLIYKV